MELWLCCLQKMDKAESARGEGGMRVTGRWGWPEILLSPAGIWGFVPQMLTLSQVTRLGFTHSDLFVPPEINCHLQWQQHWKNIHPAPGFPKKPSFPNLVCIWFCPYYCLKGCKIPNRAPVSAQSHSQGSFKCEQPGKRWKTLKAWNNLGTEIGGGPKFYCICLEYCTKNKVCKT